MKKTAGDQSSCDVKLQVTMVTRFSVVLSMCYNSDFGPDTMNPGVRKERRSIPTKGQEL